jgi:hypothetical protein
MQRLDDVYSAAIEINVLPSQTSEFARTKAVSSEKSNEQLQATALGCGDDRYKLFSV